MSTVLLSPHIVVGPPMMVGNRSTTYLKDRLTGQYFRLSALEQLVIESVGRGCSRQAIAAATSARLGRVVPEAAVGRLFDNLLSRGILVPGETMHGPDPSPALPQMAPPRVRMKGPFEVYVRFGRAAGLTKWAARALDPLPDSLLEWLALVGALFACQLLWVHRDIAIQAVQQLAIGPFDGASALFLGLVLIASLLHELAHAVACARNGGQPGDIGVMFRYCAFAFYCRIDDLVVMQSQRARLTTILAGPVSHIFVAAPFMVFCLASNATAPGYHFCIAFVAFNMGIAALNLLPFVQLDGYLLLSTGWKYPELRQEAQLALRECLGKWRLAKRGQEKRGVTRTEKTRTGLIAYGAVSLLCTGTVCAAALLTWLELCWHAPMVYGAPVMLTCGGVMLNIGRRAITLSRRNMVAA
jgi:putative peptide zinc metalloprotease protein